MASKWLDVHESAVQSFIREGGEVSDLLNDVVKGAQKLSRAYLTAGRHVRSRRLWNSVKWNRTKLEGPLQGYSRLYSNARHTLYVHEGTGYISHPKMIVPMNRRKAHTNIAFKGAGSQTMAENAGSKFKGTRRKDGVQGQRAKPFLTIGLAKSMAAQRLR